MRNLFNRFFAFIAKALTFLADSARESVNKATSSRRIILYAVTATGIVVVIYATATQKDVPATAANILEILIWVGASLVGVGRFIENKTPIAFTTSPTQPEPDNKENP